MALSVPLFLVVGLVAGEHNREHTLDGQTLRGAGNIHGGMHGMEMEKKNRIIPYVNAPYHDPDWFNDFAQGESTYDVSGSDLGTQDVKYGVEPGLNDPYDTDVVKKGEWFHESVSGGSKKAWQTHYPGMTDNVGDRGVDAGQWSQTPTGNWRQEYQPSQENSEQDQMGSLAAAWFDSSVNQYDGFGRKIAPDPRSGERYVDWEERSVNTTVECAAVGCVANATIKAFDGATERGRNCKMSFAVHPTDFDDQYSKENVEWVLVNGVTVSTNCDPMASGCNSTAQKPLYTCLMDRSLDTVIGVTGELQIAAKLSPMVDECPYNGKLLAGVAWVTCMVAPRIPPPTAHANSPTNGATQNGTHATFRKPLRCATHGCKARAVVDMTEGAFSLSNCKMNVFVMQTDFDNELGVVEQIEYIKVDGTSVGSNISPGKNPCKTLWTTGTPLPDAEKKFQAVTNADVATSAEDDSLVVDAKITDNVDECASKGYLLDGYVEVVCDQTAKPAATAATTTAAPAGTTTAAAAATTTAAALLLQQSRNDHRQARSPQLGEPPSSMRGFAFGRRDLDTDVRQLMMRGQRA